MPFLPVGHSEWRADVLVLVIDEGMIPYTLQAVRQANVLVPVVTLPAGCGASLVEEEQNAKMLGEVASYILNNDILN